MNRAYRNREGGGEEDQCFAGTDRPASAEDARSVLLAAVDRVIQLATNQSPTTSSTSSDSMRPPAVRGTDLAASTSQSRSSGVSTGLSRSSHTLAANHSLSSHDERHSAGPSGVWQSANHQQNSTALEHRRLFGHTRNVIQPFEPFKSNSGLYESRKGKYKRQRAPRGPGRPAKSTWKKECICLKHILQTSRPSAEERMELARDGLGLGEVNFHHDGDAGHIHKVLMETFPQLNSCGGYTLCRLSDNSHSLIEIDYPAKGLSVPYLKDILNQAKLYIRPLQSDISDAKDDLLAADNEPYEHCWQCDMFLPMSKLSKHVMECAGAARQKRSSVEVDGPLTKQPCLSGNSSSSSSPLIPGPCKLTGSYHSKKVSDCYIPSDSDSDMNDTEVQAMLYDNIDGQLNLESAIRQHNVRVITKKDEPYRIVVRRESLLEDGLAEIWKKPHNRPLQVTFRDEPGIDQGGVRREFFNLVLRKVSLSSALMDGEANRRVLRHNAIAVQERMFYRVGCLFALSILNSGPGPSFLAPCVVQYLFHGMDSLETTPPSLEDVPDSIIEGKISQIAQCESEQELRRLLDDPEYDFRFSCGVGDPASSVSFTEKTKIVKGLILQYTIFSTIVELEQMKQGLTAQKFDELMKRHPDILMPVFESPEVKLTSALIIEEMYCRSNTIFSARGVKRMVEEAIFAEWVKYVKELEDRTQPTLEDLLEYLTGSSSIPPSGFGYGIQPMILFDDNHDGLPIVSACTLSLTFPTNFPTVGNRFKEKMDFAIMGSKECYGLI